MPRCIPPWRVSTIASSSKVALSIGHSAIALPIAVIRKGSSVSLALPPRSLFLIARGSSRAAPPRGAGVAHRGNQEGQQRELGVAAAVTVHHRPGFLERGHVELLDQRE